MNCERNIQYNIGIKIQFWEKLFNYIKKMTINKIIDHLKNPNIISTCTYILHHVNMYKI